MERKPVALLVRHGDTEANEANVYRSRLDPPLNAKGFKQADKLASYIKKHFQVSKITTNPLLRAVQTADRIAEELGLEVIQDRALFPWHLGFLGGKDKEKYEPILKTFVDNPKEAIPDGESLDSLEDRIHEFFDAELKKKLDGEKIPVYVTHTSDIIVLDNLLKDADGKPEMGEATVGPGGLVAIYPTEGGFEMEPIMGEEEESTYGS